MEDLGVFFAKLVVAPGAYLVRLAPQVTFTWKQSLWKPANEVFVGVVLGSTWRRRARPQGYRWPPWAGCSLGEAEEGV